MIDSFLYLLARRVLSALVLRLRSKDYKELEIILLRQEVAILRRQVHRPESRPVERAFLAAASRAWGAKSRSGHATRSYSWISPPTTSRRTMRLQVLGRPSAGWRRGWGGTSWRVR